MPANQKYALNDDVWPDGTNIKKGDYIVWDPWAQGRSEKVWGPDAKQFKPERWITPEGELRRESQGQWPAFHAGPRTCLGILHLIQHVTMQLNFATHRPKSCYS